VSNETQNDAEARPGEQATVLSVRDLPYLAEDLRVEGGAFEEGHGAFASDYAQLVGIGEVEQVGEDAFLFRREVEDCRVCRYVSLPQVMTTKGADVLESLLSDMMCITRWHQEAAPRNTSGGARQ
jgi:hypothetical protein